MTVETTEPTPVAVPVGEMTNDEMLRELVRNQRMILELVQNVTEQVGPTLEALKSSAIGKMFGM